MQFNKIFFHLQVAITYLVAAFFLTATSSSVAEEVKSSRDLGRYIEKHCKIGCVDPALLKMAVYQAAEELSVNPITLLAIIQVESNFRPKAINRTSGKSIGLTQIQVYWHRDKFLTKNQYDIFDNVRVGAMVYRDCVKKWKGQRDKALWCYNGHQRNGMKQYVPKVNRAYRELSSLEIRI